MSKETALLTPKIKAADIKNETDPGRRQNMRRQVEGAEALVELTKRNDTKKKAREALVRKLKPVKRLEIANSGPAEPTTNDIPALQAENRELKQRIAELEAG